MSKANLMNDGTLVLDGKDGIIIRKHIHGLEAGRVLDFTDYTAKVVPCGLPIITDGYGNHKPLAPIDGEGLVMPQGFHYAGLCAATVLAGLPVSVITVGVVNWVAMLANIKEFLPTPNRVLTKNDLTPIKEALPHIVFECDEDSDLSVTVITDTVFINDQTSFTNNFSKLANYYAKNPTKPGYDGTYPGDPWVVANYAKLNGTLVIDYNGTVIDTVPGITEQSTYVIISVAGDLNLDPGSFDLSKLKLYVTK